MRKLMKDRKNRILITITVIMGIVFLLSLLSLDALFPTSFITLIVSELWLMPFLIANNEWVS